jgi:hypothetical protein|tara:strand:- start:1918 stop:2223 length:306 start_codon:yes stop_codon:yes gene_type:complete
MIIRVNEVGDVWLDEHDVFTGFHVDAHARFITENLAEAMGEKTRTDGKHLWIAENAVRRWLSGRTDEAWEEGFSRMFEYARSRGWTDQAGTHLRAHIEYHD